jgi:hypothetical protein
LLDVAIRLNKARLAQIPADREDALARSRERAKIRAQWQREQAEFDGRPSRAPRKSDSRERAELPASEVVQVQDLE